MKKKLDSLEDFLENNGKIMLPFSVVEYNDKDKSIVRECIYCGDLHEQRLMKELSVSGDSDLEPIYTDKNKWYSISIFICKTCWFENDISDASNWIA